ncbi:MAG: 4Fe-4S dicluster domain-containing protein [Actinobacteria bacterium]|nr:4Fe-4S dicluster domain-containing protein [Actinomycetota bacterium]
MSAGTPAALDERLRRIGEHLGTYRVGVADMTAPAVQAAVREHGGSWLAAFPRAVSLAFRLQDAIVDQLPRHHRSPAVARTYSFHIYSSVNDYLDEMALHVARAIQEEGHAAVPVPASLPVDADGFSGALSHKLAANLAGLGWIGRSCLLVAPKVGPRLRLVTVLTDAPLATDAPLDRDCGSCTECVEACPAGAFSGKAFDPAEPRSARMDVQACADYREAAKAVSGVTICGVCVAVCPHGRRSRRAATLPA